MSRTLIQGVDAITLHAGAPLARDVDIAIEDGQIRSIGAAPTGFAPDEVIRGAGRVAVPGLFNAHCHAAMTLERGWAEDLPFDRWLNEKIWRAESALTEEDVYWGAALAACEMIRSGTVGFADHYFFMDQVAQVVEECGLRALLAWCWFGRPPQEEVGGTRFETTLAFVRRWHGAADGRVRCALGPHSPYMCSDEALSQVAEQAGALGVPIHLHVAESAEQVQRSLAEHGASPVGRLARLGVLEQPCIAAHCLALQPDDVAILAEKPVRVVHTPKTYMKLAMAKPPMRQLLGSGVQLALGTDGPASSSDLNMLEVLRLYGLQHKQELGDPSALPWAELLELGTAAGARALGFCESGRLRPGAAADLLLVETSAPHWYPRHSVPAGLVYASHPSDITHLWVNGRLLMRDGELLTLDEERIRHEAERRALRMVGADMAQVRSYDG